PTPSAESAVRPTGTPGSAAGRLPGRGERASVDDRCTGLLVVARGGVGVAGAGGAAGRPELVERVADRATGVHVAERGADGDVHGVVGAPVPHQLGARH